MSDKNNSEKIVDPEELRVTLQKEKLDQIVKHYLMCHNTQLPKEEQYSKEELHLFYVLLQNDDCFKLFTLGVNVGCFMRKNYGAVFITKPKAKTLKKEAST